jgi:hypothetical protein
MTDEKVKRVLPFSIHLGDYYSTIFTDRGIYLIKQSEPMKTFGISFPGDNILAIIHKQKANKKIAKEKKRMKNMSIKEVTERAEMDFKYRDIVEKIVKEGRVAGHIIIFIPTHRRFIKHRRYEIEFPLDDFNRIANFLEPRGFLVKTG